MWASSPLFYSQIPKKVKKENPFAFLFTPTRQWKWLRVSKIQKWKQRRALVLDATEPEAGVLDEGAVTQVVDLAKALG